MANRPFEDGDWIYFKEHTGKAVVIGYDQQRGKVYAENGYIFNQDNISYISTPRKGSKEARDIVAMLARDRKLYLSEIRKHWNNENVFGVLYWEKRKAGIFNSHSSFLRLEKAKSMLK